jgi:tRNA threonylcarbamoyladenosine biosynthesis protein TsaB
LVPVIDARRGEVYGAVFSRNGEATQLVLPGKVEKVPELLAAITHPQACFVGGGAAIYKDLIVARPGWRVLAGDLFLGRAVSRIASRRAEASTFLTAAELQAYYLRRPDAELKWKQQ